MLSLSVHAVSLHAGRPLPPDQGATLTTTDFPPPSTVKGFIESLTGKERGWFRGRVAVGLLKDPGGRGTVLKKGTYWSNARGVGPDGKPISSDHQSTSRVVNWDFLLDVAYRIVIDGSPEQEEVLRQSLRGEIARYGILSLGTSEDEVYMLNEKEAPARWLVEGQQHPLTVTTGHGFSDRNPVYKTFDLLGEPIVDVPEGAWVSYGTASGSVPNLPRVG